MSIFEKCIPNNTDLDQTYIIEARMKSFILPELPNNDELQSIASKISATTVDCFSYEYGRAPISLSSNDVKDIIEFYNKNIFTSVLTSFDNGKICVWVPDHHEYFVIFGSEAAVEMIKNSGIFEYPFDEYVTDLESPASKFVLLNMKKKYTV